MVSQKASNFILSLVNSAEIFKRLTLIIVKFEFKSTAKFAKFEFEIKSTKLSI